MRALRPTCPCLRLSSLLAISVSSYARFSIVFVNNNSPKDTAQSGQRNRKFFKFKSRQDDENQLLDAFLPRRRRFPSQTPMYIEHIIEETRSQQDVSSGVGNKDQHQAEAHNGQNKSSILPESTDLVSSNSSSTVDQRRTSQDSSMSILKGRWIRQQFREVLKAGGEAEAKKFLDKLLEAETVKNADLFLEELVHYKLSNLDYGNAFSSWSKYATIERTIAGADKLLEYILRDKKDIQSVRQARIKNICEKIQQLFTASDAFAECASAYLVNGKYEEAKFLATYYVISPRSFISPIRRLVDKGNPQLAQRFSRLFQDIYLSTVGKKPKRLKPQNPPQREEEADTQSVKATELSTEDKKTDEDLKLIEAHNDIKFLLETRRRKKHKFMAKKPKVKRYEVNHRQLDILMRVFDEVCNEIGAPKVPRVPIDDESP